MKRYLFCLLVLFPSVAYAQGTGHPQEDLTVGALKAAPDDYIIRIVDGRIVLVPPTPIPPVDVISAESDLANWRAERLPASAIWHSTGHDFNWQIAEIKNKGRRLFPSFPVGGGDPMYIQKRVDKLSTDFGEAIAYCQTNALPLTIRANNIGDFTFSSRYDLTPTPTTIPPESLRVWRIVDGALKDKGPPDIFGPADGWRAEGVYWGASPFMQKLVSLYPNPSEVHFLENNETNEPSPYLVTKANPAVITPDGIHRTWFTADQMGAIDVRLKDRVTVLGFDSNPYDFLPEYYTARVAQWQAFYSGFREQLPLSWRGFTTVAYKADPNISKMPPTRFPEHHPLGEQARYDSSSSEYYVRPATSDFTSRDQYDRLAQKLQWRDYRRSVNPKAFTEFSISIASKTTYSGLQAGKHKWISPALYGQYLTWALWTCHDGGPLIFRYWENYDTLPGDAFFPPEVHPVLDGLGLADAKTLTVYDYESQMFDAIDTVCKTADLRKFWQFGTKLPWVPAEAVVQSWPVAIQQGDEVLVFVWSPVETPPAVTLTVDFEGDGIAETVTVPGVGYWVASAAGVEEVN